MHAFNEQMMYAHNSTMCVLDMYTTNNQAQKKSSLWIFSITHKQTHHTLCIVVHYLQDLSKDRVPDAMHAKFQAQKKNQRDCSGKMFGNKIETYNESFGMFGEALTIKHTNSQNI